MAGEKAKENKTLVSACAGCGKVLSTELLHGVVVGHARQRRVVAVCQGCRDNGWTPEKEPAASAGA